MDFLSQTFTDEIVVSTRFKYHWRCEKLAISHLCFADDLLILLDGIVIAAEVVRKVLNRFYDYTGLLANDSKSCLFLAGVNDELSQSISQVIKFPLGQIPMKYLGIPLISTKL